MIIIWSPLSFRTNKSYRNSETQKPGKDDPYISLGELTVRILNQIPFSCPPDSHWKESKKNWT